MRRDFAWLLLVLTVVAVGAMAAGWRPGISMPTPINWMTRRPMLIDGGPGRPPAAQKRVVVDVFWLTAAYLPGTDSKRRGWLLQLRENGYGALRVISNWERFRVAPSAMIGLRRAVRDARGVKLLERGSDPTDGWVSLEAGDSSVRFDAPTRFLALKAAAGHPRIRHLWATLLRAIPNPNPDDRPEDWEK